MIEYYNLPAYQRKALIDPINLALGVTLTPDQVNYIVEGTSMPPDRQNGKTFAYCIHLSLSSGEPLNANKPLEFCDYPNTAHYAIDYFRHEFRKVYTELEKIKGLKLRSIVNKWNTPCPQK